MYNIQVILAPPLYVEIKETNILKPGVGDGSGLRAGKLGGPSVCGGTGRPLVIGGKGGGSESLAGNGGISSCGGGRGRSLLGDLGFNSGAMLNFFFPEYNAQGSVDKKKRQKYFFGSGTLPFVGRTTFGGFDCLSGGCSENFCGGICNLGGTPLVLVGLSIGNGSGGKLTSKCIKSS